MLSNIRKSMNRQHMFVYACLLVFWFFLRLFSENAFDLGWGFFPLVVSLPFVPFVLVWLAVQFYRHLRLFNTSFNRKWHACHCTCTSALFSLFIFQFIY